MKIIIASLMAAIALAALPGNHQSENAVNILAEKTDSLPLVLPENHPDLTEFRLRNEAAVRFSINQLPADKQEWDSYRIKLRENIIKKAGVIIDHDLPLDVRETVTLSMAGYGIKNIFFQTRPGIYATANLYIPEGKGPFPGVLVMCGHSTNGRLYDNYQSVGHTLALNGYVALVIDPWGAGERTTVHGVFEYHGANLGASLLNIGETLMGNQLTDNMRGVDLLVSLPFVDKDKIGATGSSGGGNQTMWLAALDDRVKAAVPVVSVGTFESYVMRSNCVCELLVDGLTFTEEAGVLALANAIMPCNHLQDSNPTFFPSEMLRSYNKARQIFVMQGKEDAISNRIFDIPHGYYPEDRQAMLGWFDLKLKGTGTGVSKTEIPFDLLPAEKLMTFTPGTRDANVISTEEHCKKKGAELREEYLANRSFNVSHKRQELQSILRIAEKPVLKHVHRFPKINGWDRIAIETSDGKLIPVLHFPVTNQSAGYVILCDPLNKNNISPTLVEDLKKKGCGVVIIDLTGTGELVSFIDSRANPNMMLHTFARGELWLGKTALGEWVKDLEILTGFLRSDYKARKIVIAGAREAGMAGLFLAALEGNIDEVVLREAPLSYLFDNRENIDFFSLAIHLPGILKWGDISLAVGISGKKVTFINPVTMSGQEITELKLKELQTEFDMVNTVCQQHSRVYFLYGKE